MAKRIRSRVRFLFAQPSWLQGAARVFDGWGVYDTYNFSESPDHDVAVGFVQDWLSFEDDARASLSKHQIV